MVEYGEDPAAEQAALAGNTSYLAQVNAVRRTTSPYAAQQSSDLARNYPGMTPDTAAALSTMQMRNDNPELASIVRRDYVERGLFEKTVNNTIGRVTRPATAFFYDAWDQSITRWMRFAVQQYQNPDKGMVENLARAGTGAIGRATREVAQGNASMLDMATGQGLGTGLVAGAPEDYLQQPGAGTHFENLLREGASFAEAATDTEEWVEEKYGANIMADAWAVADATRLHVTVDGIKYDYGVSAGRFAVTPMFQLQYLTPHTVPANMISGGIDLFTQVATDPLDPLFDAATRWWSVRKALQPEAMSTMDQAISAHGGLKLQQVPMRGMYHTDLASSTNRTMGTSAEGYAFFGGPTFDPTTGYLDGGMSLDLDRATGYAQSAERGGKVGAVYAVKISDLQPHLQKHLEDVGEIEQFVVTGRLAEAEQYVADDYIRRINSQEYAVKEAQISLDEVDRDLARIDPEYEAWLDGYDEWVASDRKPELWVGEKLDYLSAHMPEEDVSRFIAAQDHLIDSRWDWKESVFEAKTLDNRVQAAISQNLETPINSEHVFGDFPAPIESAIPTQVALEMSQDGYFYPGGAAARDSAAKVMSDDLGVAKSRGRWEAKTPERFLESRKGENLVKWLVNPAVSKSTKLRHLRTWGVEWSAAWALLDDVDISLKSGSDELAIQATNEHITELVNGRMINRQSSAPIMGRKTMGSGPIQGGEAALRDVPRKFSDWGRRWGAHSTPSKIDPWDFDATFDTVTQFLETIEATPAAVDKVVQIAREASGDAYKSKNVLQALISELELSLARKGLSEQKIEKIIVDYFEEQQRVTLYNINRAGNPIGEGDSVYTLERTPGGLEFKVLIDQVVNDAEMSVSSLHVPSVRDARRVTSNVRRTFDKMRDHPIGLKPSTANKMLDGAAAGWRNMQLLRPGWMMSVVPDEMMRAAAEGHVSLLGNPMFAWNVMMRNAGNELPSGRALDEIARMQGGLGTGGGGGWARSMTDEPLQMSRAGKAESWQAVDTMDAAGNVTLTGAEQISRNWIRLYQSQLWQSLYAHDDNIEDAIQWLTQHPEGKKVLDDILTGQGKGALPGKGTRLSKLGTDDQVELRNIVRLELESLDAQVLMNTGGDWIKRDPENTGQWVNSGGARVETYEGINPNTMSEQLGTGEKWNATTLWEEILRKDPEASGRTSVDGKRQSVNDLRVRNMQLDGVHVDLKGIPTNQSYVTIKKGDRNLRNIMGVGRKERMPVGKETAQRFAMTKIIEDMGMNIEDSVIVRIPTDEFDAYTATGYYDAYTNPGHASRMVAESSDRVTFILVNKAELSPEGYVNMLDAIKKVDTVNAAQTPFKYEPKAMRTLNADDMRIKFTEMEESGDVPRIFNEMTKEDFEDLTDYVRNEAFAGDIEAPARVKGPSTVQTDRLDGMSTRFIDNLFDLLGSQPSLVAARNPYSRVRTWEVFADYYIYATPQIKREIRRASTKSGIPKADFDKFIERSNRLSGHTKRKPAAVAASQLTLDEIENVAVTRAIEDTRDLFFDLSKRGNWADASKLVFPFADAWWEVLTRWGKLFNPLKAEEFGRPFKNLHRIQQATMGTERAGWFETNERGERVFKWFPGAAIATEFMNTPEGFGIKNTASMNQLGFIDFSDTRAILAPGMGPYMQIPAAAIRPFEGTAIQSVIDWAVFGSFAPGEVDAQGVTDMLLPTYLKKLWAQASAGEHDERFASMTIDVANTLFASGDPKYADIATNRETMEALMDDARRIVGTYGWVDVLVSWVAPLQPKAVVELVNTTTEGTERVIQMTAVADDYGFLNRHMDEKAALATIVDWYGEDPLMVARKSYGVLQRPMSDDGYDFSKTHPTEMGLMPYTVGAFMPIDIGEEFSSQEYQRQIEEGDRQKLTAAEAFLYLSYRQGQTRIQEVRDEKDRRLQQAEMMWGKDSESYRDYRDMTVAPWYSSAKMSLEAMYFGYSSDSQGPVKLRKRPSTEMLMQEMLAIGDPGSTLNRAASNMDSELTELLEQVGSWWRQNDTRAIMAGHDVEWWYTSASTTDPTAALMRSTLQTRLQNLITRTENQETRQRLMWYVDSIITPLMHGYDMDSPFIVDVDPLLAPEG